MQSETKYVVFFPKHNLILVLNYRLVSARLGTL